MRALIGAAVLLCLASCNAADEGAPAAATAPVGVAAPDAAGVAGLAGQSGGTGKVCTYPDGSALPPPGLSEDAMQSLEFGPMMARTYGALSAGDRSVNAAALRDPEAVMLTSACSPNHVFWTHLSLVDMTRPAELPLKADAPAELRAGMRAFSFTDRGRQVLPSLLNTLERRRSDGEL